MINEVRKFALRKFFGQKHNCFLSGGKDGRNVDKKQEKISEESLGNYKGLVYNMRKDANVARKQRLQERALFKHNKQVQDHLVELTLYMEHNNWRSQFIYLLLNYYKLGFKVVSDYAFLDSSSYMLELRNRKQEERWPTVRVIIGLNPRVIVTGLEQIEKFFVENLYFNNSLIKQQDEHNFSIKFINQQILPYMESLLWHPTLTYQTTFHTDLYYHQSQQKNYMLVEILLKNFSKCGKSIIKQKQRYLNSKQKFSNALRQMSDLYLKKSEYFGGQKPNFIDFYLFSQLKTKWGSKYFKSYVQEQISQEFKRWLLRMGWNCQYSRDRVTVL